MGQDGTRGQNGTSSFRLITLSISLQELTESSVVLATTLLQNLVNNAGALTVENPKNRFGTYLTFYLMLHICDVGPPQQVLLTLSLKNMMYVRQMYDVINRSDYSAPFHCCLVAKTGKRMERGKTAYGMVGQNGIYAVLPMS